MTTLVAKTRLMGFVNVEGNLFANASGLQAGGEALQVLLRTPETSMNADQRAKLKNIS